MLLGRHYDHRSDHYKTSLDCLYPQRHSSEIAAADALDGGLFVVSGRIPAHRFHNCKMLLDSERHNFEIAAMDAFDGGANIVSQCVSTGRSEKCRNFWAALTLSFKDFAIAATSTIDGGVLFSSFVSSPVQNFQQISDFSAPRISK